MNLALSLPKRWLYICIAVLLLVAAGYSLFYLVSGYDYLVNWWTGLRECFYENEVWTKNFFNPKVKGQGNLLSILGLFISLAGIFYFGKKALKKSADKLSYGLYVTGWDGFCLAILFAINFTAWLLGKQTVPEVGDEIRSAIDIAVLHPFQTLSYYMLPNNHILFNLINNLLPFTDKVLSGKIISLISYFGFTATIYFLFRRLTNHRFFALAAALTLSLQFPVWGFSFQGRGYELYAVAGWAAVIAFILYLKNRDSKWLVLYTVAGFIGYAIVPVFLYIHISLVCFVALFYLKDKNILFEFGKYQVYLAALVFLFYLPAFSFSGISAFSENKYMAPKEMGIIEFLAQPSPLRSYIDYTFSQFEYPPAVITIFAFFSPLLFLLFKRSGFQFRIGVFFILLIGSVALIAILTKRNVFHRTIILQFSIVLGMVVYLFYLACNYLSKRTRIEAIDKLVFGIALITFSTYMLSENLKHVKFVLYFSDMNGFHYDVSNALELFPEGSSIAASAESYNWRYLGERRGLNFSECIKGDEDYIIIQEGETYPPLDGYELVRKVIDYDIYKREE